MFFYGENNDFRRCLFLWAENIHFMTMCIHAHGNWRDRTGTGTAIGDALDQGDVWVWVGRTQGCGLLSSTFTDFSLTILFSLFPLFQAKSAESKKAKKAAAADGDSDEEEALEEIIEGDSEIESDEYDIPYDGEEDDIECDGELAK